MAAPPRLRLAASSLNHHFQECTAAATAGLVPVREDEMALRNRPDVLWRPKSRPTALQRPDPGYGLSLVTLPLAALATTTLIWFAHTDRVRPASQRHSCC